MDFSLINLFGIAVIAFVVPFVAGFFPRIRVPAVVLEILAGILVGPQVLGWLEVDDAVSLMSTLGVAFLLFLAGLELNLAVLRGAPLRLGVVGFALSFLLAVVGSFAFAALGVLGAPLLTAVALCSTSVGIIVPVLRDTGTLDTAVGRFTVAGGAAGEFGGIALLGILFGAPIASIETGLPPIVAHLAFLALFATVVAVLLWAIGRAMTWGPGLQVGEKLEESSSQIGTRAAVMLVLGMALVAETFRFEPIFGTFLAGIFLGAVIRGFRHEHLARQRLEAVGYGFFVPFFFIASGMRLDVAGLFTPQQIGLVAIATGLLLVIRGLPAVLYRSHLTRRGTIAAGLMQSTNLSFIVVAVAVGLEFGVLPTVTGSALVMAGLVSAIVFPAAAQTILAGDEPATGQPIGDRAPTAA